MVFGLTRTWSEATIYATLITLVFSYDSCDVGVMPNQTDANGPPAATMPLVSTNDGGRGRPEFNLQLSMLPGQRLRFAHPHIHCVHASEDLSQRMYLQRPRSSGSVA